MYVFFYKDFVRLFVLCDNNCLRKQTCHSSYRCLDFYFQCLLGMMHNRMFKKSVEILCKFAFGLIPCCILMD